MAMEQSERRAFTVWFSILADLRGSILSTSLASLLALTCSTARADLLLYDGFATATDAQGRTPYLKTSATHKLQSDNAKSTAWTTGLSSFNPWSESSSVVFSLPNDGLSLPSAFADGVGDQFAARGGCAGYLSNGTGAEIRCKNRKIASTMPTTGTLYYRCLMRLEAKAYDAIKGATERYVGTGLSTIAPVDAYDNQEALANGGFRIGFNCPGTTGTVNLGINIAGQYRTVLTGITAGTTYLCVVKIDYTADTASVYATPIADYSKTFDWTVKGLDASKLTSAFQVMFLAGVYQTNGGRVQFDEIAAGTTLDDVAVFKPATAPQLGDVSLSRTGSATYSVTAVEAVNTADTVSWIANDGATATTNAFATAVAAGATASGSVSGLEAGKTYQISILAENAGGSDEKAAGVIYTGALTLDASTATDASEYGLVAGGVTVSRAAADPLPLTVNYTISGSAGAEGTTWAAPVAVTIPAGKTSGVLSVVPMMDGTVTEDVTITVALASGNYELPASNAATLTLVNLAPPPGKKTWVATANGNASDGANWSPSGAPAAMDEILFDGNFSNARCIWDAAATHTVASWTQDASFTGTIELQTTYESGAFAALAIMGDCAINGGTMTQTANSNAQTYRLSLTIGGDLSVASGAQITATGKGYAQNCFPKGSAIGVHGGSVDNLSKVYGDLKHPVDIGSGGGTAGMNGGGAVHIVVTGDATIGGTLAAQPTRGPENGKQHGAGGSIYLQAASVGGAGTITAAGYGFSGYNPWPDGAGGRVAIILTTATSLAFSEANLRCNGTTAGYARTSGGGTVFVKTAAQQNGVLIIPNSFDGFTNPSYWPTKRGVTPIPAGQTWTLDEIHFRGTGVLCVPKGATLNVPLSGISASSERTAGILYEGGTIDFGTPPYALSGNWVFQADQPYTFDGDVTVSGGASLGCLRFSGSLIDGSNEKGAKWDDFAVCDVLVNGNLTIASGGYASAELGGPCGNDGTDGRGGDGGFYPRHGGQYATHSGNRCYGSVFNPVLPGQFAQDGDHGNIGVGGGAIKLTATGDLVVDGKISANGIIRHKSSASGGSVNITAKTLSGSGSITARGVAGSIQWDSGYNGVGGRIAVRVTGEDVGADGIWDKFAAMGCSTNNVVADGKIVTAARNQNTSAGTIYLQGKSDGEKGGTIYVKNQKNYDTSNVATWIPAASRGDSAADFANAKLVIADRGVVAIGAANMKLAALTIESNSRLDLHGETLRVKRATVGGVRLAPGTYAAGDEVVSGFVADSGEGGKLVVTAPGLSIIIR